MVTAARVIFIRFGALGDVLTSLPALKATLDKFPQALIEIVGEENWTALLDPVLWPRVSAIHVGRKKQNLFTSFGPSQGLFVDQKKSLISLPEIFNKADVVVDLQYKTTRYTWQAWRKHVPVRIGCSPWYFKWLFTHWSPWLGVEPPIHEKIRQIKIVNAPPREFFPLGFESQNLRGLSEEKPSKGIPSPLQANAAKGSQLANTTQKFWIINPTTSERYKAWSAERFAWLCKQWLPTLKKNNRTLRILGSAKEMEWLKEVSVHLDSSESWIITPSNMKELFNVISAAEAVVTNTSSVQHIAACVNTACLTLAGSTEAIRWGPLGQISIFLRPEVDLSNCKTAKEKEKRAYKALAPELVYRECQNLLNLLNSKNENPSKDAHS